MPHKCCLTLAVFVLASSAVFGQAAQKGVDTQMAAGKKFRIEYVHYRPATWERKQVVEIERDRPNEGGLLYFYVRNIENEKNGIRFWQYQNRDRTYWIQNDLAAWDRIWKKSVGGGELNVIEVNGISKDFAPGTSFNFTLVDDSFEPAMRYEGILAADTVNVALIRVLPSMNDLEVHLRHTGVGSVHFSQLGLEGLDVSSVQWRGQTLAGPGHAIARLKLAKAVEASTLLVLRVDLEDSKGKRSIYAHRRAYPDSFPIGTWGLDAKDYEFLHASHIDTGVKDGQRDDDFFGGNAAKYGFRSLTHVGHWPENVKFLQSLSGHPSVFAWMLGDEPDWSSHVQKVVALDETIKALDSTKPTMVTLCRNVKFMEFAPIADIPCMDHYCVTAPTASVWEHKYGGRLEETGFYTRDLKYASEPKPVIVWSQGITQWEERPKRGTPTKEELSVQLIQNLGRGAKGILWFTWKRKVAERYPELYAAAVGWNKVMQTMKDDFLGSEPADLGVSTADKVDAAALVGWDRVILCISNLDYQISDEAYPFVDKRDVDVSFSLPEWINPASALLMTGEGVSEAALSRKDARATVTLPHLRDAAILVLTNNAGDKQAYDACIRALSDERWRWPNP